MAVVSPQVDCCACSTGNRSITWQSHCVCFASGFSVTAGYGWTPCMVFHKMRFGLNDLP